MRMIKYLARFAHVRPLWFLIFASLTVSLFFYIFSGLDIAISRMFFDQEKGFYISFIPEFEDWRIIGLIVPKLIIVWFVVLMVLRFIKGIPKNPIFDTPGVMYVFLSGFLSTLILINLIFKEYWGRPRPRQIDIFGGEHPFVPVWRISDYCAHNCSFISGEASGVIWSLSMLIFLPKRIAKILIWPLGFIALILSINRIMFGGHFASDVILSILITLAIMHACWLFVHSKPGQISANRLDKMFDATGNWISQHWKWSILKKQSGSTFNRL